MDALKNMGDSSLIVMVRAHDDLAFSELVERYAPLLNKYAKSFSGTYVTVDEAYAEACFALYRAALSYDISNKDVTFGLYAGICIRRRLSDLLSSSMRLDSFGDVDVNSLAASAGIERELETRETLERAMSLARGILSEYEYKVFRLYLKGFTTKEIADALSKSSKSVDNAKLRMLRNIRELGSVFSDD